MRRGFLTIVLAMVVMVGVGRLPTVAHVTNHDELGRRMGLSANGVIGTISAHIAVKMQLTTFCGPCVPAVKALVHVGVSVLAVLRVIRRMCITPPLAGIVVAAGTITNMAFASYACEHGCVRRAALPRRSAERARFLHSARRARHP